MSAATAVGGCLWRVNTAFAEHHVIASDSGDAEAVYLAIPSVAEATGRDPESTTILEVKRLDVCVFALPITLDDSDDRSQA